MVCSQYRNKGLHTTFLHYNIWIKQSLSLYYVCNNGPPHNFRNRKNPYCYSALPTFCQELGSSPSRCLRIHHRCFPGHQHSQSNSGPNSHHPTNANDLATSNGSVEEDCANNHIWPWLHVGISRGPYEEERTHLILQASASSQHYVLSWELKAKSTISPTT